MPQPLKNIKSILIILGLALISISFSSNASAQDQKINVQKIMQKKHSDAVGLNPQPVPPKDDSATSLQQMQLQTNTQNAGNTSHITSTVSKQNHETSQEIIKNIKSDSATTETTTGIVESADMQKIVGSVQIQVSRGWINSPVSTANFREICPKINLLAKKSDGEIYKFTPAYHATRPAFGLPGGKIWCETERISVPANEDIYFIASLIDDDYKITPMTQKVSIKVNELQTVSVNIIKKEAAKN